jgi:hypothetical protein
MGRPEDTCQMFALLHVRANGHSPKESHTAPVVFGDKEVSEALACLDVVPVYDEDGGTIYQLPTRTGAGTLRRG